MFGQQLTPPPKTITPLRLFVILRYWYGPGLRAWRLLAGRPCLSYVSIAISLRYPCSGVQS